MESLRIKERQVVLIGTETGQVYYLETIENRLALEKFQNLENLSEIGKILIDTRNSLIYIVTIESEILAMELGQIESKLTLRLREEYSTYNDKILDIKQVNHSKVLVCTNSNILRVYDFETGQVSLVPGHKDLAMCCDVSGGKALTGSKDGKVYLWSIDDHGKFTLIKKYKGHSEPLVGVCLGQKTQNLFVSGDLEGNIKIWKLQENSIVNLKASVGEVNFLKLSKNEKFIAVGSRSKLVEIYSVGE